MPHLGIEAFDIFLKNDLRVSVLEKYWNFEILSEADLQAIVWQLIVSFLKEYDPESKKYKVFNKLYLKGLRVHPDIVVFRKEKPWVVIELKECRRLKAETAQKERDRLLKSLAAFHAKRGYLIYAARFGNGKVIHGPKGPSAYFFFEVPIVLEAHHPIGKVRIWEDEFKYWSKYVGENNNA